MEPFSWGPGVKNPNQLKAKVKSILNSNAMGKYEIARAVMTTMTWEQACELYRNSNPDFKVFMNHNLINLSEHHRFKGMSKETLMKTIGKPDDIRNGKFIYTGAGYASDSTSGSIFSFDEGGRVVNIAGAN